MCLSDLGRLREPEGQIILGAAVIDDILGLMILTVVAGLTEGKDVNLWSVVKTTASAIGFLVATIAVGRLVVPVLFRWARRVELPGTPTAMALIAAFGLAWLAEQCGSAHHWRFRRRAARRGSSRSPSDRARDHRDRPLFRAALFRRRRNFSRFESPGSIPPREPVRAGHWRRVDRDGCRPESSSPAMLRFGFAAIRR